MPKFVVTLKRLTREVATTEVDAKCFDEAFEEAVARGRLDKIQWSPDPPPDVIVWEITTEVVDASPK